jgi:hypothetical protein
MLQWSNLGQKMQNMDRKIEEYRTMRLQDVSHYVGNKPHLKRVNSLASLSHRAKSLNPMLRELVDGAVETARDIVRRNPGYDEASKSLEPSASVPRPFAFPSPFWPCNLLLLQPRDYF